MTDPETFTDGKSRSMGIDGADLELPPAASPEEAAAIAAAIGAYLADQQREADEERPRDRWSFAGRMRALNRSPGRIPGNAPRDPWTASGRIDRL